MIRLFSIPNGSLGDAERTFLLSRIFTLGIGSLAAHRFYAGQGSVEAIDWSTPLASAPIEQELVPLHFPLTAGTKWVFAARSVSARGVEEHGTEIFTFVEINDDEELLSPPLPVPVDLEATLGVDGVLRLTFTSEVNAEMDTPASFEILTDFGSGELDTETIAMSIPAGSQTEYSMEIIPLFLPALYAIRSAKESIKGQPSAVIPVYALRTPNPPGILPEGI